MYIYTELDIIYHIHYTHAQNILHIHVTLIDTKTTALTKPQSYIRDTYRMRHDLCWIANSLNEIKSPLLSSPIKFDMLPF